MFHWLINNDKVHWQPLTQRPGYSRSMETVPFPHISDARVRLETTPNLPQFLKIEIIILTSTNPTQISLNIFLYGSKLRVTVVDRSIRISHTEDAQSTSSLDTDKRQAAHNQISQQIIYEICFIVMQN